MKVDNCVAELAKSVADPFRYAACIPDGSTGTGKFSTKATVGIGTGAAGTSCFFALNPGEISNEYFQTGASTATAPPVSGSWVAAIQSSAVTGLYSRMRPVSAGFRAAYTGSTMNDQGVLVIGQVPASIPLSGFNGLAIDQLTAYCQWYKILPLRAGGEATWRPCDVDDQAVFALPAANGLVSLVPTVSRPYLIAAVYGCASSTASVCTIEYVVNWEGQFRANTFSPGGLSMVPPTPAVGWYERAHAMYNRVEPIVALVSGLMASGKSPATNLITTGSRITVEELD
jgi:hypothetical protein